MLNDFQPATGATTEPNCHIMNLGISFALPKYIALRKVSKVVPLTRAGQTMSLENDFQVDNSPQV